MNIELTENQIHTIASIVAAKVAAAIEDSTAATKTAKSCNPQRRDSKFLKISDFAREFNVTSAAVHKWILQRKIFAQKIGKRIWRIPAGEIERFRKESLKKTAEEVFMRKF